MSKLSYSEYGFEFNGENLNYFELKTFFDKLENHQKKKIQATKQALDVYQVWDSINNAEPTADLCKHQAQALSFLNKFNSGLIAYEIGLGKSRIALKATLTKKTLIICPKIAFQAWRDEAKAYPEWRYTLINYEQAHKIHEAEAFEAVIIDECQKLADHTSKRFKAVSKLVPGIPQKILLSGTPLCNRPSDFYAQVQLLGGTKGLDFYKSNEDNLFPYLTCNYIFQKTRESAGLPNNAKLIALKTKVSDTGKTMEGKQASASAKMQATIKQAREDMALGKRIVIFSEFISVVDKLHEEFKDCSTVFKGGVNQSVVIDWEKGVINTPIMIATRQSLSCGLSMKSATVAILNDLPYTWASILQALYRIYRLNSIEPVNMYFVISDNDFDKNLMKILATKKKYHKKFNEGHNPYKIQAV